jgi:hypothetical protein
VGRRSNRKLGWIVLAAVALLAQGASAATLNKRARLREGPSKDTRLLGWVEDGTAVTLEGEQRGWYSVRTPDGQTGFIWQEHLRFDTGESAPAILTVTVTTSAPSPTTSPAPLPTLPMVPPTVPEARPAPSDARASGKRTEAASPAARAASGRSHADRAAGDDAASRSRRPRGGPPPRWGPTAAPARRSCSSVGAVRMALRPLHGGPARTPVTPPDLSAMPPTPRLPKKQSSPTN